MIVKSNRKAFFDYEVIKEFEAGIVLEGWEVKSIKAGNIGLQSSFILSRDSGVWLRGATVSDWPSAPAHSEEIKKRDRKLLLNKEEIQKIDSLLATNQRYTIVPLEIFLQKNLIKVKLGVVRSRKKYEKKSKIKERDLIREIHRDLNI